MQIKPQTLMIAIQCVAVQTRLLDQRLQIDTPADHPGDHPGDDPDARAELAQTLLSFDLAAEDLKTAYGIALTHFEGLPPYDDLVAQPE